MSPDASTSTTPGSAAALSLLVEHSGVRAVVTGRAGGVSTGAFASLNLGTHVGDDPAAVAENRRRAVAALGLGPERVVFVDQVHGDRVLVADDTAAGAGAGLPPLGEADAIVTATPDLALGIMVADCVPGVLVDTDAGVLGVFHAGWKGTVAGIAARTVEAMADLGADPARIRGALGPCMPFGAYQVDEVVSAPVRAAFGDDTSLLAPDGPGHHRFDLHGANLVQLERAGVTADRVDCVDADTTDDTFFSHRRGAPTGRFALLAALTSEVTS